MSKILLHTISITKDRKSQSVWNTLYSVVDLQVYAFSLFIYPLISVIQEVVKLYNTMTYHIAII